MSYSEARPRSVAEERASDHTVGAFLGQLPSDTPVYCYNEQYALDSLFPPPPLIEDFTVVVKSFPPTKLNDIDVNLVAKTEYSTILHVIIITMPSQPREEAVHGFEGLLSILAHNMGVFRKISKLGSTRITLPDRKKQADCSWKPAFQARQFPTVALEAGYTETAAKLQRDMERWIHDSRGQVKMGITIYIKRGSDNIEIKSWAPTSPQPTLDVYIAAHKRQVVDRRVNQQPTLQVTQRILINRGANGNHSIEGGGLIIPFETLLLAQPGQGEGDFIFTTEMLLDEWAVLIWAGIDEVKMAKARSH
ncbi:uncharacterized protein TRUGW13939_07948 [Talaromyces rugulosus]|uniref:Uncharacterized protein n=1 Tax=Talaromyces rugulosus TaxID=121627 RepID=A0A7H8R3D0_TALRU|nr:uncharacterized protein TRUGW13939_07948 [Talaromyces rugulosus]QKX60802.1 hypothetical protein TRUGW13939_07948 [Talaromyces rugulosus]